MRIWYRFIITIILFSAIVNFFSCKVDEPEYFVDIEALPFNDTLTVHRTINIEEELALLNPFRILNLNDEYLIISELKSEDFFNVLNIPELKFMYSFGRISSGPEPNEFIATPLYLNKNSDVLIVFEGMSRQLRHISLSDSSLEMIKIETLSYEGQLDPLNRVRRINDDLYFADYGLSLEDTNNEHIALRPDQNEPLFTFGKFPETDLQGIERYQKYNKENLSKPDGSKFASFYFNLNMFKIYNNRGEEENIVRVEDDYIDDTINSLIDSNDYLYRVPAWASENYIYLLGLYASGEQIYDKPNELESIKTSLEIWDWDGNPVYRAMFDRQINNFTVSETYSKIYAYSNLSEKTIFEYDIESILKTIK